MRNRSKLLLAGLCATFLLAAAVGTASANHLSVSEQAHRSRWTALRFEAGGFLITCEVELEGSFHSATIAKVANALIGHITEAAFRNCTGGNMTAHRETLPWHWQYRGFTGTLPRIETASINLVGALFRIAPTGGPECEAGTTQAEPGIGTIAIGARGEATSITAGGRIRLSGAFACSFANGTFSGAGTVTTAAGGTMIIRLIGEGESRPATLTPSPVEFGRVEPEELARRTVTITAGTTAITVNRISVVSGNYFAITDPNRCVGARLSERGTCAFKVLFAAPGEAGRALSDTVRVETTERTLEDTVRGST